MVREGEKGAGEGERGHGVRQDLRVVAEEKKKEVEEGNLSLEGLASTSLLHPSIRHSGKRERLKAMDKV